MIKNLTYISKTSQMLMLSLIAIIFGLVILQMSETFIAADKLPIINENLNIETKFEYLVTDNDELNEVIENGVFTSLKNNKVPYQLDDKFYWIKIKITNNNKNNQTVILHADNPMLDKFDVYLVNQDSYNLLTSPEGSPKNKTIKALVFPNIQLDIAEESTTQILIKLRTYGPPNVPLIFYTEENFEKRILLTQFIFGAFIGVLLMIAAYNTILYMAIKDKVYLIYLGYLFSSFFVLACINGFGYYVLPISVSAQIKENLIFIHYLVVIFLIVFTLYFLRYQNSKGIIFTLAKIFVVFLALCSLISSFLDPIQQASYFFTLLPVFYIFALCIILPRIRKDYSWARFYFISWIFLLVGAAVQPLLLLNKIEYSFLARNAFLLSVLIEICFMAFALAERMRRNEQDRLNDLLYHTISLIPRKLLIEQKITELINVNTSAFYVVAIKPEQIDTINLYVDKAALAKFYKQLNQGLSRLFSFNRAIITLNNQGEKICMLDNGTLLVLLDINKIKQPTNVLVNSIQEIVEELYKVDALTIPLSANIGIARYPEHGDTSNLLINRAQLALPLAQSSQYKWAAFEFESSYENEYLLKLAVELKQAIKENTFELYHQPQIDLKTRKVCGSECLLRWKYNNEDYIPPKVFISVAEDMGIINELTLWVIKTALSQHQNIIDNGYNNHMLSINISANDFCSDSFYQNVVNLLEQSDLPPEKIIFELKESITIKDNEQALISIDKFIELGITISIDDFGTGYSSLAFITTLPFNELKIDRQFVENVRASKKRMTIAETTTKMAKGLGLEVVAEGISSIDDEQTMKMFGCDIGQGYFYADPMPINSYIDWLKEQVNGQVPSNDGQLILKERMKN